MGSIPSTPRSPELTGNPHSRMAASPLTWSSGDDSQVDVMRDGTQVRKTPRSITIWTREVIRLSTPSCTVFGSSPTLTTKNKMDYAGAYPEKTGRTMYTTNRNPIT